MNSDCGTSPSVTSPSSRWRRRARARRLHASAHHGALSSLSHRYVDKSDLPEPELRKLEKMVSTEVGKPKTEEEDFTA